MGIAESVSTSVSVSRLHFGGQFVEQRFNARFDLITDGTDCFDIFPMRIVKTLVTVLAVPRRRTNTLC